VLHHGGIESVHDGVDASEFVRDITGAVLAYCANIRLDT
jgi:hypothetical protein